MYDVALNPYAGRVRNVKTVQYTSKDIRQPGRPGRICLSGCLIGSGRERLRRGASIRGECLQEFPAPGGGSEAAGGSEFASEPQSSSTPAIANGGAWRAGASEGPVSAEQSSPAPDLIGSKGPADANVGPGSAIDPAVTIANGAIVEIDGPSAQSVTFTGRRAR